MYVGDSPLLTGVATEKLRRANRAVALVPQGCGVVRSWGCVGGGAIARRGARRQECLAVGAGLGRMGGLQRGWHRGGGSRAGGSRTGETENQSQAYGQQNGAGADQYQIAEGRRDLRNERGGEFAVDGVWTQQRSPLGGRGGWSLLSANRRFHAGQQNRPGRLRSRCRRRGLVNGREFERLRFAEGTHSANWDAESRG